MLRKKKNTKNDKRIKAIVFDVGGVMVIPNYYVGKKENDHSRVQFSGIHENIAHKLGLGFDRWFDAIDSVYAKSIVGEISKEEFIGVVSKRLNVSRIKLVKIVKSCYKKRMKRNNILFRLIKTLRKKYIVGILSDQWPLSRESIFPKKENKNFDFVIISYEVKLRKPHPKIYRILLNKITSKDKSIKPEEVLFIDDKDYNLEPAKNLGIKTLLFKNNRQLKNEFRRYGII